VGLASGGGGYADWVGRGDGVWEAAGEEEGLEEDFHGYRVEKCSSVFFEDPPLQKFASHEILSNDAVSELIFV
jgi:hypothetical protein